MIMIRMKWGEEGIALEAIGHAEHGAIGHDIVCAGVSALLYGLSVYLEGEAKGCPTGRFDRAESVGRLYLQASGLKTEETALAVTKAGLCLIAEAFPEAVQILPWENTQHS